MSSHQSIPNPRAIKMSEWVTLGGRKIKGLFSATTIGERMKRLYHYQYTPHHYLFYSASFHCLKLCFYIIIIIIYDMIELSSSSSTETPQVPNLQLAICILHQSLQGLYSDPTCTSIIYIRLMSSTTQTWYIAFAEKRTKKVEYPL